MWRILCTLLLISCVRSPDSSGASTPNPIVSTKYGDIKGFNDYSINGRIYSAFMGIPYAAPPIGEFRFKEPQPLVEWSGVWVANSSVYCLQVGHGNVPEGGPLMGDEDCLYLSVYVPLKNPKTLSENKMDVIVHIHSGAYNFGAGDDYAGPKYLMDRDIIFVTINYRLGPLGFLSTADEVVPGNNGMKDQVAALRWVRENIENFGGNSDSITLTGLSAGGASVHMHLLSPLSRGLFKQGISMSGVALDPWPLQEAPLTKARIIGDQVGCNQESTRDLIECLKRRPARKVVEGVRVLRPWLYNPFSPFGLVVDKHAKAPFLPDYPYKLLAAGKVLDAPWITSVTSEEGLYPGADFMLKKSHLPYLEEHWNELVPSVLDFNFTVSNTRRDNVIEQITRHYLGDEPISNRSFMKLIKMMSDRLFVAYAEKAARMQARVMTSPVYFYYFSYSGIKVDTYAWHYTDSPIKYGVCHGDDVMYIVSNPKKDLEPLVSTDLNMKELLLNMWESFARTGIPIIKTGLTWNAVTPNKKQFDYLHIASDTDIKMESALELGDRSFWESLHLLENENL